MTNHADTMNAIYRHQRFIYDVTRRPYLFGRDRMLAAVEPPPCGSVLEIGCGTARNLLRAARLYPDADFFGIDLSGEMLKTARAAVARSPFRDTIQLAEADAATFSARNLFGLYAADRIVISYALSMIPAWEKVLDNALTQLAPRGELHIVDFGSMNGLHPVPRRALRAWLRHFSVTPRLDLSDVATKIASRHGRDTRFSEGKLGYAAHVRIGQHQPDGLSTPLPDRLAAWLS
ncbi:SAM-dependent methyltransferase [Hyphomicrobium methylovorum]|uniref:class I SAM-dependent methyltransferase n=1 Tax=Hyphomicrobium methylovorum TaxID=84 RepID=UPI0015E7748B|nr:class I SAM-dependent methyltransferase [Hyphomicrobium methylovorum]MBA2126904.1 SAM-dependent methyltransferase [Hyphomicrobium methylovorum]